MTLSDFLVQISENGVAVVTPSDALDMGEGWQEVIQGWDAQQRLELAFGTPELSLKVAAWAAMRFYRGCQALVCRDMAPQDLQRYLEVPCPEPRGPSADYSADLVFRFLPDLITQAHRVAQGDPLVEELLKIAGDWPLSSVGIKDAPVGDPAPFWEHPGLRQLYVDRILAMGDTTRLRSDGVRSAVQGSLGAFPDLAPTVAAALSVSSSS